MSAVAIRRLVILLSFSFFGRLRAIAWKIARCQFENAENLSDSICALFSENERVHAALHESGGLQVGESGNNCHIGYTEADNPYISPPAIGRRGCIERGTG